MARSAARSRRWRITSESRCFAAQPPHRAHARRGGAAACRASGHAVLEASVSDVAARTKQGPLVVSCLATFMMRWLIPRLYAFSAAHPGHRGAPGGLARAGGFCRRRHRPGDPARQAALAARGDRTSVHRRPHGAGACAGAVATPSHRATCRPYAPRSAAYRDAPRRVVALARDHGRKRDDADQVRTGDRASSTPTFCWRRPPAAWVRRSGPIRWWSKTLRAAGWWRPSASWRAAAPTTCSPPGSPRAGRGSPPSPSGSWPRRRSRRPRSVRLRRRLHATLGGVTARCPAV